MKDVLPFRLKPFAIAVLVALSVGVALLLLVGLLEPAADARGLSNLLGFLRAVVMGGTIGLAMQIYGALVGGNG